MPVIHKKFLYITHGILKDLHPLAVTIRKLGPPKTMPGGHSLQAKSQGKAAHRRSVKGTQINRTYTKTARYIFYIYNLTTRKDEEKSEIVNSLRARRMET